MFITTTTHNPTNNIFIHFLDIFKCFSKLQILFLCLAIVPSLSSPMSSMHLHHLKKLHLMLTPLLLYIRQNDNQKINTNAFFFYKPQFNTSHLVLWTPPKLPPTIFDSCGGSQNCKFPTIANGSNKIRPAPTTMARIRWLLLHFHSVTNA